MTQEKSPEDEAFEALERRQTATEKTLTSPSETIRYRDAFPKEYDVKSIMRMQDRNVTLEEVAAEFDNMKSLGDTAASFAAFVRGMKK